MIIILMDYLLYYILNKLYLLIGCITFIVRYYN